MTSPNTPPPGQPDPAALLALGLATQAADAGPSSVPPLTPAELAAEFPQLEILELLGRGGMGAVYKARQRDLDRLVALKILRPGLDADPGFAERFTREARALAKLNHPGIVTLYEFGKTTADRYFILMEFVDGMNLRQLLAAGRLSPREALAIVPPLCDALQYAHDRGLVHRDIKPENLLIDRLGRIKIADFGIAKITATKTDSASAASSVSIDHSSLVIGHSAEGGGGTPAYMAPEQRTHPASVDHRADLYALGVVFYQMLTGELPAAGQLQPPSTRVQLDVRLDEIVLRALEKDPARRYAAASEFKTQVETVSNTAVSSSPAAGPSSENGFSYRSRRTLFGLPLLHVATGVDPATGKRRIARGIVAIGDYAQGVFAFGGFAMGAVSFGGFSLGLLSYGGLALGLLTIGGMGIGALASFSGLAVAPIALGGNSIGWYAYGGAAWGRHVSSPARHDPAAVDFFGTWAREFTQVGGVATFPLLAAGFIIMFCTIAWARKRVAGGSSPDYQKDPTATSAPLLPASVLTLFLVCFCGSLQFAAEKFPERIALHFNAVGQPDAWAERSVALLVLLVIGVGISFFIPCLFALLRVLPARFLNIPHSGFWLAPARAAATHARLLRAGIWIAALNAAFFWGLQILSHWAHLSTPPRLPMVALWFLTGLFHLAITVSIIRLYRTFSRADHAPVQPSPSPSRLARALRPAAPWLLLFLLLVGIIVPVSTAFDILHAHPNSTTSTVSTDSRTGPLFRFGQRTREITLLRSHPVAYDFDQERFVDYVSSPQSPHGIEASLRWHADHGTDVFADPSSYLPGVLFLGTELAEVAPSAWDGPADEVARRLGKPGGGVMTFIPAPAPGQPPTTQVYRTPQGALMLVQLLRATDAGDVTLRYKAILAASSLADPGSNDAAVSAEDQRPLHFDRAGSHPLPANPPLASLLDSASNTPSAKYILTAPLEIILPRQRKPGGYNFETGQFLDYAPTSESPHGIESSARWREQRGIDIFADSRGGVPAVGLDGARSYNIASHLALDDADTLLSYLEGREKNLPAHWPLHLHPDPLVGYSARNPRVSHTPGCSRVDPDHFHQRRRRRPCSLPADQTHRRLRFKRRSHDFAHNRYPASH